MSNPILIHMLVYKYQALALRVSAEKVFTMDAESSPYTITCQELLLNKSSNVRSSF